MSASYLLSSPEERSEADGIIRFRPSQIRCRTSEAGSLALVETPGAETAGDGRTLSGTFSVFDTWQEIREAGLVFMERIAPNAFAKTIRENRDQVPILFSHGKDPAIGAQLLGALRSLSVDNRGAHYTVDLFPGVPPLLEAGLKEGRYGSSFRARVIQEEFSPRPGRSPYNPRGLPESVVKEVKLIDIGPTPLPAYPSTSAQVRSDSGNGRSHELVDFKDTTVPNWFLAPADWYLEEGST